MRFTKHLVLVLVILALIGATPLPSGTTTARSPAQIGETIKQLTNQLMETNSTSDIITLDTRTPPKIKQQTKKKIKEDLENSHAGVAIPIDEDEIALEETTKKLNFYKVEKPTTNSGLSTWILLSGQTTPKPKPIIKPNDNQNVTLLLETNKIKPIFKKRITTSTTAAPSTTKLTKIKASILADTKKSTTILPTTTEAVTTTTTNSSSLPLEAKDGENDLNDKTTKRPSTKRKKNKNRRRRPSEKTDDSTKIDKSSKTKEKPIGTQLYNYLSREVMPTVGVGLVGLMVTAGLASYFLYPFGVARHSYDIDRKDTNNYYYNDEYSGGIAEEEAIGKVIAGMPSNSLYGTNFKTPTSRHNFNNRRIEQSTAFSVAEDEVTPAAVPEHGPRRFNFRKRRDLESENEIDGNVGISDPTTFASVTTTDGTTTTTTKRPDKVKSFVDMLKELFHLKVHLGLQLIQNATQAVSKYVSHVQRRLDQQYHNYTLH